MLQHGFFISPTCLQAAFMSADPKSTKGLSSHQCLFVIVGSALEKAACKILVKLTPEENNLLVIRF